MAEDRMLSDEVLLALIKKNSGGGGGTSDYEQLDNLPRIGGVELVGNKTAAQLGLATTQDITGKQDALTAGDYIQFDGNEISVNREIPNETVSYEFKTKGTSEPNIAIIVTKRSNGSVVWEREYQYLDVLTPIVIDDAIKFGYQWVYAGQWTYEMLVASDSHAVGYRQSWGYLETKDYTEDFSLIDNTGLKLVIKSEMDSALDEKADTDMVAADFNAGTSYTAGNYCVQDGKLYRFKNNHSGAWSASDVEEVKIAGELSSIKSGFTNLDNEVNGDATVYPYADVITIEDAVPSNLAECNVKVEPVQNLHGYDNPWVGGAGKNKLPLVLADIKSINTEGSWSGNTYTKDNATFVVGVDDANNVLSIIGTGNGSFGTYIYLTFTLAAGSYVLSSGFTEVQGTNDTYLHDGTSVIARGNAGAPGTNFTLESDTSVTWYFRVTSNSAFVCTPMIRLATETDATFAPYTNICPISGHTEASVQRDGKNLWEFAESYSGAGGLATNLRFSNSLKPNTYVLSCKGTFASGGAIQFTLLYEDGSKPSITLGYDKVGDTYYSSRTFTKKIVGIDNIYSNNAGNSINDVQLELGSSATDFEPYQGKTYTIALGDTIYGGTVDFDSGVMTVDSAYYQFNGTEDWIKSSSKSGSFYKAWSDFIPNGKVNTEFSCSHAIYNSDFSTYKYGECYSDNSCSLFLGTDSMSRDDFKAWILGQYNNGTPVEICYELATPTTIQLTPQQIQLLKGTNTLTASTGQISVTVNGVSGSIGAVQEQVNATDAALAELAADIAEQLPDAPTTDGAYVLTVTVADGIPTYSWVSAE